MSITFWQKRKPCLESETEKKNYVLGQTYAVRAYSYFMLAQMFLALIKDMKANLVYPLRTEPTDIATEGKGRATIESISTNHFGS